MRAILLCTNTAQSPREQEMRNSLCNRILFHIQDVREYRSRTAGSSTLVCTTSRDPMHDNKCAGREEANSFRPELICYRLHSTKYANWMLRVLIGTVEGFV